MDTISSDSESRPCPVVTPVSFEFQPPDEFLFGSDPGCLRAIKIEGVAGIDPCHAKLIWNPNEWAWHLVDDPAPGKTYLNGDPVDGGRLYEGDEIGIAGVRFRFSRKSDNVWEVAEIKDTDREGVEAPMAMMNGRLCWTTCRFRLSRTRSRQFSVPAAAASQRSSNVWQVSH